MNKPVGRREFAIKLDALRKSLTLEDKQLFRDAFLRQAEQAELKGMLSLRQSWVED
jgi:hypothetical protein